MEKQKEERKRMKEEREQRKEDRKRVEKCENQQRSRINKAFEKIPRFDGTNPSYCFDWLEQTEALVNEHHRWIYQEELLLNCGTSMSKTIHTLPQGATNCKVLLLTIWWSWFFVLLLVFLLSVFNFWGML